MTARQNLEQIRIVNGWDAARRARDNGILDVFISYTPDTSRERGGRSANWSVVSTSGRTDPDGPWYNYGNKTFPVYGVGERETQLEAAKKWAAAKFGGPTKWAQIPGLRGYWFPQATADLIQRLIKEARS